MVCGHKAALNLNCVRVFPWGLLLSCFQVLVFLDSHIEVNVQWLEPLLARIKSDRRAVVVPFVDTIDSETFVYSPAPLVRGGFTWSLLHNWDPLPESFELHNKRMSAEPIEYAEFELFFSSSFFSFHSVYLHLEQWNVCTSLPSAPVTME